VIAATRALICAGGPTKLACGDAARRDRGGEGACGAGHDQAEPWRHPRAARFDVLGSRNRADHRPRRLAFDSQVAEAVARGPLAPPRSDSIDFVDTGLPSSCGRPAGCCSRDVDALLRAWCPRPVEADNLMIVRTQPSTRSDHPRPQAGRWASRSNGIGPAALASPRCDRQDLGPGRDVQPLPPDLKAEVLADLGSPSPGSTIRPARPSCRGAGRDRHQRRLAGAVRDRGPQPPAHRDQRAHGAVPSGPEGQLRDAPQAQPDRRRADRRARPPAPWLRRRGVREPAALARSGHQPLVG